MLKYPLYNGYKLMIKRPACKKQKSQKRLGTSNCMAPSRGLARDLLQFTHNQSELN